MSQFQHAAPEIAENPLPPTLAGETALQTPLHRLRLRQLQDLAKAYGIQLPDGATKNNVLPIMVAAEQAGTFRQAPKSRYHLLHAEMNHDEKLAPYQREAREQAIARAEADENRRAQAAAPVETQADLRARCKALGLDTFGKSNDAMRQMIKDAEARNAGTSGEAA